MGSSLGIFWHRRDLRLTDNNGLNEAAQITSRLTGLYIYDPKILSPEDAFPPISQAKLWFLLNSLLELQKQWSKLGSELIIIEGEPTKIIPSYMDYVGAEVISWNRNIEPYERYRDEEVTREIESSGKKINTYWDQMLIEPTLIKNKEGNAYKVYTPFYNAWVRSTQENKSKLNKIVNQPKGLKGITDSGITRNTNSIPHNKFRDAIKNSSLIIKNKLSNNTFKGQELCPCLPGEKAARSILKEFTTTGLINQYKSNRDLPYKKGTSTLSASFNLGTLSCREAFRAVENAKNNSTNIQSLLSIQTWEKELAWREFYQYVLLHFPELKNGAFRKKWNNFKWANNTSWFYSWRNGYTGFPIIDASMRQLNLSGWMHNRCRMVVASFLVKDLICNWQLGERAFMELLVDGDLAANNGGWQWSSSSGMDTKPLRIFNPEIQAKKFDSKANYIRYWLPEISHISTSDLLTGEITAIERRGYPEPLVSHQGQQNIFKKLYADINS